MIKLIVVAVLLLRSLYLKLLFKTLTGTAVYKDAAKASKPKSEFPFSYKRHLNEKRSKVLQATRTLLKYHPQRSLVDKRPNFEPT